MNKVLEHPTPDIEVAGKLYLHTADGGLMPKELIAQHRLLEDQLVRTIIHHATTLSAQIDRFKGHTADDIGAFQSLLEERFSAPRKGGKKGNVTFQSFDGTLKVEVRLSDRLTFGPELQTAKTLIDACISEWSADANGPIRLLVNRAFQVDEEGRINRNAILGLRTVEIADQRWQDAMRAITESIRVIGRKTYFRFSRRADPNAEWESITIDLASARAPAERSED
jgi:hypothetical protein